MKVWVSRDNTNSVMDNVKIWQRCPMKEKGCFSDPVFITSPGWLLMSAKYFKESFDFTPRKGSCKEYELNLLRIDHEST